MLCQEVGFAINYSKIESLEENPFLSLFLEETLFESNLSKSQSKAIAKLNILKQGFSKFVMGIDLTNAEL